MEKQSAALITLFSVVVLFSTNALAVYPPDQSDIIPDNRRINWSNAGVPGGIPKREVCVDVTDPPYNAKGDGVTDSRKAIQDAINACAGTNKAVLLPSGTYKISGYLDLASNVVLRGEGPHNTIIIGSSGMGSPMINFSNTGEGYPVGTAVDFSKASLSKGSTTLTTLSNHGWQANQYILIDAMPTRTKNRDRDTNGNVSVGLNRLPTDAVDPPVWEAAAPDANGYNKCSWCGRPASSNADTKFYRVLGQVVKITAVTANTVTIDPPLYIDFGKYEQANVAGDIVPDDVNGHVQGIRTDNIAIMGAGLEKLTLDNTVSNSKPCIKMDFAINSWIDGIMLRSNNPNSGYNLDIRGGFRSTIQNSFFRGEGNVTATGSQAYGMRLIEVASAMLFQNNIYRGFMISGAFEGGWGGNVVAYNYTVDLRYPNNSQRSAFANHATHPFMNLYEGNYNDGSKFLADAYFGNSSYQTYFRNRVVQKQNGDGFLSAIDLIHENFYNNIVGNVLGHYTSGTTPYEKFYERSCQRNYSYDGDPSIYRIGYLTATATGSTQCLNPNKVKSSLLRWGNWDSYNKNMLWDSAEIPTGATVPSDNHLLPASLYLSGKPGFFKSDQVWPPFGPNPTTASTLNNETIPAKVCFESQLKNVADGTRPAFNPDACYGTGQTTPPKPVTPPRNFKTL